MSELFALPIYNKSWASLYSSFLKVYPLNVFVNPAVKPAGSLLSLFLLHCNAPCLAIFGGIFAVPVSCQHSSVLPHGAHAQFPTASAEPVAAQTLLSYPTLFLPLKSSSVVQ